MSNDTRPEIRFPEFTDEWEQRKLINYTKLITKGTTPKDKTGSGKVNFVKVENLSDGKILPIQKITEEEHEGYLKRSRLEEGDILFSIAGTLGRTAIVNKSILPANTNQALAIIRSYDFDKYFLVTTLTGHVVAEYIRKNPTVGAQPNLSLEQVGQLIINTPIKGEQIKIGTFFKQLDDTIALHQRKLDLLKETKKGFLQKMFPKNGAKVPEIRFPGFTEDWEERKLQEVLRERNNQQPQSMEYPLVSFTVENGVTPKTDRYEREQLVVGDKSSKKYKVTVLNDIVYNPANLKFGAISRNKYGNAVFSPIYITFLVNNDVTTPEFIEMFVTRNDFIKRALKYQQGTVYERQSVSPTDLLAMNVYLPGKSEQEKIGSFFQQLDETIALHQRKLDLLKETKKGFLQKMFV
ncbi:TPA: restriction endonuclease subunit S [Enterococcus faecium]|nr:restriction endonuclease subunit S [Enterococcus faecium]